MPPRGAVSNPAASMASRGAVTRRRWMRRARRGSRSSDSRPFAAEVMRRARSSARRAHPADSAGSARDPGSVGALRAFAEALDQKGECGVVAAATCDLLLVPRKAVLKWLDDCLAVEARHAEDLDLQAAAARRLAALPPRGAVDDDAALALGRRRAAEDDARRRARGADRALLRLARSFGGKSR